MNWLTNLFKGVGNVGSNIMSGIGNVAGGLGQGVTKLASGLGSNVGKNLTSSALNMFNSGGNKSQGSTAQNLLGSAAQYLGGQGGGSAMAQSPTASFGSNLAQNLIGGGIQSAINPTQNQQDPTKKKNAWENISGGITDMFKLQPGGGANLLAGLGTLGAGQLMAPKTGRVPDMNSLQSVQAMQNFKPADLSNVQVPQNVVDAMSRKMDIDFEREQKALEDLYRNMQPGVNPLESSNYARDNEAMKTRQSLTRSDAVANQYFTAMQQQIGANQQEMARLQELAQLDIASIMANLGLDAQEAEQFKQSFANVGSMFLDNAFRQPTPSWLGGM